MSILRELRLKAGLSQDRLGEKAYISQGHLHRIETGQVKPWEREAQAIAIVLGVEPETLFPDGYKVRSDYGRDTFWVPPEPLPPEPRRYPSRPFSVMCWKCRAMLTMRADDYHPSAFDEPLRCPECRAWFGDVIPLEEAMRP